MEATELVKVLGRIRPTDVTGIGRVKYFDLEKKQFGTVASDHGKVFIHISRLVDVAFTGGDYPEIVQPATNPDGSLLYIPRRNSEILFAAETTERGLRAVRWLILNRKEMDGIFKKIADRPTYRLMHRKGHRIQSTRFKIDGAGTRVVWEGKNLTQLRQKYDHYRVSDTDDEAIYFQVLDTDTKEWKESDDPR